MNEKHRRLLTDINNGAQAQLESVRWYLNKRKLDEQTASKYELGFIPNPNFLFQTMKVAGWEAAEALELACDLSLIYSINSEEQHNYGTTFPGRLTFPIYDAYGRITGIAGRVLDDSKPKYYNSNFPKKLHLYGLNFAIQEIIRKNFVIIVEGYLDVIAAHRLGALNVVGTMGTAFTAWHATMLSRYTNHAFLLMDGDEAGQKSTERFFDKVGHNPLAIEVLPKSLPQGFNDLDDYGRENPREATLYLTQEILKN